MNAAMSSPSPDVFRGRIVDVGQESLIVELTGNQSKLEGFLNLVQGYEILELARTGVTGLSRGAPRCALPRLTQITLHTFARGMKFLYRKVHFPDKQQKAEMLFAV